MVAIISVPAMFAMNDECIYSPDYNIKFYIQYIPASWIFFHIGSIFVYYQLKFDFYATFIQLTSLHMMICILGL